MMRLIVAAILFTGCATTLPQSKRDGMRHNMKEDVQEMDRASEQLASRR